MITEKFGLKLFFDRAGTTPSGHAFIEAFHGFIRDKKLGELMIDVADYGHVASGTNVYFCGHESDYVVDSGGGRAGLLYRRKRAPAAAGSPLDDGLARLLAIAVKLEADPLLRGLKFATNELAITTFDRLRAPNDAATFAALEAEVKPVLERVFGGATSVVRASDDPRELLGLVATTDTRRSLADMRAAL